MLRKNFYRGAVFSAAVRLTGDKVTQNHRNMKKLGLFLIPALAVLLSACNDDDGDYPRYTPLITTVRTIDASGSDYYFQRDNGQTLYPSDKSRVAAYRATDRQRAVIWFNLLQGIQGYDYNIALYAVQEIYTGTSEEVDTPARLEELGDSPASITPAYCNLSDEWLTLYLGYPVMDNSKHDFTLIVNRVETPEESHEGYLDVELRHNSGSDLAGYTQWYYVSFDLTPIAPLLEGKQGVTLKIKTQQNGTKYLRLERNPGTAAQSRARKAEKGPDSTSGCPGLFPPCGPAIAPRSRDSAPDAGPWCRSAGS